MLKNTATNYGQTKHAREDKKEFFAFPRYLTRRVLGNQRTDTKTQQLPFRVARSSIHWVLCSFGASPKSSLFGHLLKTHVNMANVMFNGGAKEESPHVVCGANYMKKRRAPRKYVIRGRKLSSRPVTIGINRNVHRHNSYNSCAAAGSKIDRSLK